MGTAVKSGEKKKRKVIGYHRAAKEAADRLSTLWMPEFLRKLHRANINGVSFTSVLPAKGDRHSKPRFKMLVNVGKSNVHHVVTVTPETVVEEYKRVMKLIEEQRKLTPNPRKPGQLVAGTGVREVSAARA